MEANGHYPIVGAEELSGPDSAAVWADVLGRPVRYAGDDVEAWRSLVGDRLTPKERVDWGKTFRAIQKVGKYYVGATRAAASRSLFIVGHVPRTYREYASDAVARWSQRVAA